MRLVAQKVFSVFTEVHCLSHHYWLHPPLGCVEAKYGNLLFWLVKKKKRKEKLRK